LNNAFSGLQEAILKVQKSQAGIRNFNNIKAKFLAEFEKETQEISAKWQ